MSLFISHGAPMLLLEQTPAHSFLQRLTSTLPNIDAVLVVSAHWQTPQVQVTAGEAHELIYDFSGFPDALYQFKWPVRGAPALARRVVGALKEGGIAASLNMNRGIDHGAWVPLSLMFPEAEVPVVQVSLPYPTDNQSVLRLGKVLSQFEHDNVLLIGSGSLTHNLGAIRMPVTQPEDPRVQLFREALEPVLLSQDRADLMRWDTLNLADFHHPTDEHFQPLLVAAAAPGRARKLHSSTEYSVLAMDAWAFD
ncbi:MAG: class III extradiol ring-cleavage dioxygenase [Alcanivoracaceae bacterium]|nr:class III extradiol ring-cleavage dioxygenase [Alcanivoracaceae bacterium]